MRILRKRPAEQDQRHLCGHTKSRESISARPQSIKCTRCEQSGANMQTQCPRASTDARTHSWRARLRQYENRECKQPYDRTGNKGAAAEVFLQLAIARLQS